MGRSGGRRRTILEPSIDFDMSTDLDSIPDTESSDVSIADVSVSYDDYRALCSAAVTSLLFGLLSVFAFLSVYLALIPLLGILMGCYALAQIRQRPRELTGRGLAVAGTILSGCLLVTSLIVVAVVYATEVPEGYERISYAQLQPLEGRTNQKVPPLAESLDGKQVFIKGYVYPPAQQQGIKSFLLVRDKGDCCFGGNPKVTDRIQVTLADDADRLTFSSRLHKVAGTFRLEPEPNQAIDAGGQVYYYLDDCQLR